MPLRKMKLSKQNIILISLFTAVTILVGCRAYSLSGTNISPDVKTITVDNFINIAGGGPPNLAQLFTERLREYYQQNSTLKIAQTDGDLLVEGEITGYDIAPVSPTGNEISAATRLTIKVKVKYVNTKDESQNFDQVFSFYYDFKQGISLSQIEPEAIDQIFSQLIFDIFNKTVANW